MLLRECASLSAERPQRGSTPTSAHPVSRTDAGGRRLARALALILVLAPVRVHAQARSDGYGIVGGLSASRFTVGFGDSTSSTRYGATVRFGARICVLCGFGVKRLTLTPQLALGLTDVRGLDAAKDRFAFSRLDAGLQTAYTIPTTRIRPYVTVWLMTRRTAELQDAAGLIQNYSEESGKRALSLGLELLNTGGGRGVDVSITSMSGEFHSRERLGVTVSDLLAYRGRVLSIGWSGPFTGADLPWR